MTQADFQPLAARLRPTVLTEFIGQSHLVAPGKTLYRLYAAHTIHSLILWGPPGVGKTTLALILAHHAERHVALLSAVNAGVKEIREVIAIAQQQQAAGRGTVVLIDEIHRFNKAQQDALLPFVESGLFTLIGATTENPSFELNNALLSRCRVYLLQALSSEELQQLLQRALIKVNETSVKPISVAEDILQTIALQADGDGRRALSTLELAIDFAEETATALLITADTLQQVLNASLRRFDKGGEAFYDQISALHKSVRGSNPDAALYWFIRMIDGGCDPRYLARRLLRMASEDIGNADPRALGIALDAAGVYERLGSPEGELALAQAIVYLAVAPKSNAVYTAYNALMADIKRAGSAPVPLHLRNAPTTLMKNIGYGKAYRYAHDEPEAYAAGEQYFPDDWPNQTYYQPVPRGLEIKIAEKLAYLRRLDAEHKI